MSKIYTKTGDSGSTRLFDGQQVRKWDKSIHMLGHLDEVIARIGLLRATVNPWRAWQSEMKQVQTDLYLVMSRVAHGPSHDDHLEARTATLEERIDELTNRLPPLKEFVVPGNTIAGAHAHLVRTAVRTAERSYVVGGESTATMRYLNRLSDYFFTIARVLDAGKEEKFQRPTGDETVSDQREAPREDH